MDSHWTDRWIETSLDGTFCRFEVIDIAADEIVLASDSRLTDLASAGGFLDRVRLCSNGEAHDGLLLRPFQKWQTDNAIAAEPGDQRTADILWQELYHRQHGRVAVPSESKGMPPLVPLRGHYTESARLERINFVRDQTGANLAGVGTTSLPASRLSGNLESYIGSVEIPIGAAGPLLIDGQFARGYFYAPIATSEGALVASITRGAWAFSHAGGITARVFGQRMMRVPLFVVGDMHQALFFATWLKDHYLEIKAKTKEFSRYAELVELDPQVQGSSIHVHFVYETGDAAGQNMTTTCTWKTCLWILERLDTYSQIEVRNFVIEANLSNDKKVTFQSFIKGRGIHVQAEGFLSNKVIKRVLKVEPKKLFDAYQGLAQGGLQAGMVGFNVNVANLIAGMFTATGQDIASVHECSVGHLKMDRTEDGIYASLALPSIIVGTVGGGTALPHQQECLEMLDCAGAGKSRKLAEIIAAFALSLDLSTAAALAGGQFAVAHEKLGRNRPVKYLTRDQLTADFFSKALASGPGTGQGQVLQADPVSGIKLGSSIITELSRKGMEKAVGHFPYRLRVERAGETHEIEAMVKSKPTDAEVINMLSKLAILGSGELADSFRRQGGKIDFQGCHLRELEVYRLDEPVLKALTPEIHGLCRDDEREIFLIVMERLQDMVLMDTADDVSGWRDEHLRAALRDIANLHARWLGHEKDLRGYAWLQNSPTKKRMMAASPLWEQLAQHARDEFPEWVTPADLERFRRMIETLPDWWGEIEALPRTLIHNDFNPRNLAFRKTGEGLGLCVYDWELATINLPQHDLAELLVFVLDDKVSLERVADLAEVHRAALEAASGQSLPADDWWRGFRCSLQDIAINRIAMYIMAHSAKHYGFMERVFATIMHLLDLVEEAGNGP